MPATRTATASARCTSTRWRVSGHCSAPGCVRIAASRRRSCQSISASSSSCTTRAGAEKPCSAPLSLPWSGDVLHHPGSRQEPRRIGPLQPCPDRLVPPLGGSPRWPLGSETPGPQIAADHRQGQPDPGLTRDQRPHRLACPQRKRQTELIGTPPGDQDAQPVLLRRAQRFLLARATAPTPTRQDHLAALRRHFDPLTDKSAVHANFFGPFNPRLAGPPPRPPNTAQTPPP